jgi:hypothetical protein
MTTLDVVPGQRGGDTREPLILVILLLLRLVEHSYLFGLRNTIKTADVVCRQVEYGVRPNLLHTLGHTQ